jgi:hypothetical protein
MRSKILAALAASALVTGGTAASAQVAAQPATAPTTSTARAGAPVSDANELRGTTAWILAAIAAGLIIWGAIELFGDDGDDAPVSP